jgi:hypothetical protein
LTGNPPNPVFVRAEVWADKPVSQTGKLAFFGGMM